MQHAAGASARSGPNGGSMSVPNVPLAANGVIQQNSGRASAPTIPTTDASGGATTTAEGQPPHSYTMPNGTGRAVEIADPAPAEQLRMETNNNPDMVAAQLLSSLANGQSE